MGSKNAIAEWVVQHIPNCDDVYDLFGGGGAISHCLTLSKRFKTVHYNELNSIIYKGFKMAINGEFKDEKRWISREDFFKLKNNDPYVAICFSFGNALRTYAYKAEIEPIKKAFHYAICFDDYSLLDQYLNEYKVRLKETEIFNRRLELQRYLTKLYKQIKQNSLIFNDIQKLYKGTCTNGNNVRAIAQNIEGLERIQNFETKNNIDFSNNNYLDIKIKKNSIIYCDPPYYDPKGYNTRYKYGEKYIDFNHLEFFKWCLNQENLVIISNYCMPNDFICIDEIKKSVSMSDHTGSNGAEKSNSEKLYIPKHQKDLYYEKLYEDDW